MTTSRSFPSPTPQGSRPASTEVEASLAELRDRLLGPPRPGEDLEHYRRRAYQARAQAAELTAQESAPAPSMNDTDNRSILAAPQALAAASETLAAADPSWTEDTAPTRP